MDRHFTEEDIWIANKHMKKCSRQLSIREIQIETMMRYHYTPVSTGKIKNSDFTRCWRGHGKNHTLPLEM